MSFPESVVEDGGGDAAVNGRNQRTSDQRERGTSFLLLISFAVPLFTLNYALIILSSALLIAKESKSCIRNASDSFLLPSPSDSL